jgi:hypothetical protein
MTTLTVQWSPPFFTANTIPSYLILVNNQSYTQQEKSLTITPTLGQTYEFLVYAVNTAGSSLPASISVYFAYKPNPPEYVILSDEGGSVLVKGKDGSDNGSPITGHTVYINNVKCNLSCTYAYLLNYLSPNDTIRASVISSNIYGDSLPTTSNPIQMKGYDSPPTLQVTVLSSTSILLEWSETSKLYNLYQDGVLINTTASQEYTVLKLKPGQEYSFGVSPVNQVGEGPISNVIQATPVMQCHTSNFDKYIMVVC